MAEPKPARGARFMEPSARVELEFPDSITTDTARVLYALWRERVQTLGRLCIHTGIPPERLLRALLSLQASGRVRTGELEGWSSRDIFMNDPDDSSRSADIEGLLETDVQLT